MSKQLPLMSATQLEVAAKPPPTRKEWFVVLAAHRQGYWSVRDEPWLSREAAEEAAEAMPPCWVYYQVVRIPALSETVRDA